MSRGVGRFGRLDVHEIQAFYNDPIHDLRAFAGNFFLNDSAPTFTPSDLRYENANTNELLAIQAFAKQNSEEALRFIHKAITLGGETPYRLNRLALGYKEQIGMQKESIDLNKRAIAQSNDPSLQLEAMLDIISLHQKEGRFSATEKWLEKAEGIIQTEERLNSGVKMIYEFIAYASDLEAERYKECKLHLENVREILKGYDKDKTYWRCGEEFEVSVIRGITFSKGYQKVLEGYSNLATSYNLQGKPLAAKGCIKKRKSAERESLQKDMNVV